MRENLWHMRAMLRSVTFGLLVGTALVPRSALAQDHFVGEIRWVAFNFAPTGWASCDGQLMSIAQNTALFALLGTQYGGNGQTTFALPDMRGRVPVHVGQGPGLSNRLMGEVGGTETVTLTTAEMPSHAHTLASHTHTIPALSVDVKASSAAATAGSAAGNVLATATLEPGGGGRGGGPASRLTNVYNAGPADVSLAAGSAMSAPGTTDGGTGTTIATGGSSPHVNMPPFLGVNCIIALSGIFPSRN